MPVKRERHPDMNLNDLDYSITYQICQNFDIDRSWELLAGAVGYSTSHIQTFELEIQRANGSPTKRLLWDWGSRGGTIRNLYDKLELINRTQSMKLLEHIVNPETGKRKEKECKVDNTSADQESLSSKSDNFSSSDNMEHNFYDTDSLPIPSMKKCGPVVKETNTPDVNFNMPCMKNEKTGNKSPMFDKMLDKILEPQGASSVEMIAHADGPASEMGNLGAASSAARTLERVRSVVEYGSEGINMSGLSESERQFAQALLGTPNYTYKDLSVATNGFCVRNRLGQGKYGEVYYGVVKNTKCAIKKLTQNREKTEDENSTLCMAAELKTLSRYRHENIVSLYGYTLDNDEVCLVYQYMTNGSLYQCLHNKPGVILTWEQRLSILRGAACGLQFLHTVDKKPVIHGAIKSGNILLDNHFEAKIGDLGLAKQATGGEVTGRLTHITKKTTSIHDYKNKAYHPPEIARGNGFSVKGDAYSFGVVIFECLSGQEAYDERREGSVELKYLVEYIQSALDDSPKLNKQKTFQDPKLKISFPTTTFELVFEVAQRCTKEKKKDRPNMVEVFAEIVKCENDHSGPEYQNVQEAVEHKGKQIEAGSIHEHHMSVKNQPSYSPGLKAPPDVNPTKAVPTSPIDLLPKDQPLPVPFRLQQELDRQKALVEGHVYVNTDQMTAQMKTTYLSDPKKLEKLEKFDKENVSDSSGKGQSVLHIPFRPGQPLENTEVISASEKNCLNDDIYEVASDPEKEMRPGASAKSPVEAQYVNVSDVSSETGKNGRKNPNEESQGPGSDKSIDFSKEFEEISDKGCKGYSSMNGIFDKFHLLAQDECLINVPEVDQVDDNEEFDIKFDFEADDSESSTITESINNDLDLCSADFNDDALFVSEGHVHYVNVQEKVSNENIDASLEEHQKKLSMYQGMTRNDSEELHERSAQQEESDMAVKNLPGQGHSQNVFENGIEVGHYQNCLNLGKGQGCESKPTDGDYSNVSAVHGNRNRPERASAGKVANIQDFLQRREPSEGHCEEYV
ncbi:uncharacterized protein LOC123530515 isoform X2 [Mercenaria mercenaria]|uniref:uncharacterized protein LOC123530515 isoform X2 n=1 Tax=Mercenaria mercenaria TaxID=6596 RepID=UPI00234EE531|nr:uncharacterized protein LOC123530515 isoform X2 [Mercenaria mercenaria]